MNYYLSSVHVNRNDANAGTSASAPWSSLGKLLAAWPTLSAGDTVYLERGSVWDFGWGASAPYWVISHGGTAGAPITLRGDGYGSGSSPLLRRTSGTGWGAAIVVAASYVVLRDFDFDGGSRAGFGTTAISLGGSYLTEPISNIEVANLDLEYLGDSTGNYSCGVEIRGYNNFAVSDCLSAAAQSQVTPGTASTTIPTRRPTRLTR